ncbi:MAG: hypothetical protein NTU61_06425 [Candidatus Altiarchaeota archaeon]|nr:hypothetical protein [Candidatus Altiarchaeota archaeon]
MKVKFEADVDEKIVKEIGSWGLSVEDLVKDSMEHSLLGSIRRKTDNLCRKSKKPVESTIPKEKRPEYSVFCRCGG